MPHYDFQCKNKHITEELVNYSEVKKGIDCPECNEKAERIYSVSNFKPTFGYDATIWNQREKHRKSMTGSQLNKPLT
jgi:putative FmdB family regulatory protein|tara:strand:- start:44 stop:274 length:231 start_codon:yes stop_codon:yes gene_type:complete